MPSCDTSSYIIHTLHTSYPNWVLLFLARAGDGGRGLVLKITTSTGMTTSYFWAYRMGNRQCTKKEGKLVIDHFYWLRSKHHLDVTHRLQRTTKMTPKHSSYDHRLRLCLIGESKGSASTSTVCLNRSDVARW